MFLTNHISTAFLLSQIPMNPVAAFGVGLVSHYLLDMVPHGDNIKEHGIRKQHESVTDHPDYDTWQVEGAVDVWLGAGLIAAVGFSGGVKEPWTFLPLMLGAMLPDFIMGINAIWKSKWIYYHEVFHNWTHLVVPDVPRKVGRSIQILYGLSAITAYFLFFL